MVVADDELHAVEASGSEALQERGPEGAVFAVTHGHAEDFAVAVAGHAGGDHHRPGHDPAVDAALDVGGVGEDVGELDVVQRPVPERL